MFVATRYATQIRSSSNVLRFRSRGRSLFLTIGEEMEIGHFYYIDDQYFKDFPDSYLMQNKESKRSIASTLTILSRFCGLL